MKPNYFGHIQLLDSAFPIGSFAHSFGLETLVQEEEVLTASQLHEYCKAMLFGAWAPCDALAVKAVYLWGDERQEELWQFDQALHLSRVASESREGLRKIGKRLLELGTSLYPALNWAPLTAAIKAGHCPGTYPLVYGWFCHQLGVPLEQAATGLLYTNASSCLSNATRAMRIGQTQTQSLLVKLLPLLDEAWIGVAERDPWEFETSVPASDIAMMRHETLYSRLFMS